MKKQIPRGVPRSSIVFPILVFFFAMILTSQAQVSPQSTATSEDEEEVIRLSPFLVTEKPEGYLAQQTMLGARNATNVLEIPTSVVIIPKAVLQDIAATSIHEALAVGVSGFSRNQASADDFSVRGFRLNSMLVNGVARRNNGRLPLFGIERIETMKGPSAMLLGNTNFLGGAVNVILQQPTSVYRGDAMISIGDHGFRQFGANVSGPLTKSAKRDGFSTNFRLSLGYLHDDMFRATEWRDQRYYGGALELKFGDRTRINFSGYFAPIRDTRYPSDFLDVTSTETRNGLPVAKLHPLSTPEFAPARGDKDQVFWNNDDTYVDMLLLNQLTENTDLRVYYSFGRIVDFRHVVYGSGMAADNYTYNRTRLIISNDRPWHTLQIDLLHRFERDAFKLTSAVGFDGDHGQTLSNGGSGLPSIAGATTPIDVRQPVYGDLGTLNGLTIEQHKVYNTGQGYTRTGTAYFQENLSLLKDRLILVGGLRWLTTGGYTHRIRPTPVTTKSRNASYRVHKYGIIGRLHESVSIYYTNAENIYIRTGFNDLAVRNDGLGGRQKNQEGVLDEFGVKVNHRISDKFTVQGTLAVFDMALTNVPTEGLLVSGVYGTVQSEKDSSEGWELDAGITYTVGSGNLDDILTIFDAKGKTALNPNLAPSGFSPRIYSLLAKYAWKGGVLKGLGLGASIQDEAGKRWIGYEVNGTQFINCFAIYDLNEHWGFQLNISNLKDERYITGVNSSASVDVADPRRISFTTRYRW